VRALIALADDDELYIPIVFAVYCGMRRSEALGVSWKNVDFEKDIIHVCQKVIEVSEDGKTKRIISGEMKTESSRRSFYMVPELKEILLRHKAKQERYRKQFGRSYSKEYLDMVCVNPLGELTKPSYVTSHFPELLKKYGLRDIRFHDLRHTCASLLLSMDVNMKVIQKYLGHSNMSTTADIYSHLDVKATGEAGMKLGKLLSEG
jgi:integrase